MKKLDYKTLQPLSKNIPVNKTNKAESNLNCMLALLDYRSNFEELIRDMSVYDATSLIIAEQDWIKRRKFSEFKGNISIGQICKIDFGKTYRKENAYIHYSLFINSFKNKYLVIPMTTSEDEINKAYHPHDNKWGEYRLRLAKIEEGFPKKSAMYMNDVKFINPNRIIKTINNIILPKVLDEIILQLINIMFPDFYKEYKYYKEFNGKISEKEIAKDVDK